MNLSQLCNNYGAKRQKKRLGRGIATGKGKTCGKGVKGQKSRSGVAIKGFEGGQMPIIKRLPKRGFNCPTTIRYNTVTVADIETLIISGRLDSSKTITKKDIFLAGVIKTLDKPIKLLSSHGKLKRRLIIQFDAYSKAALDAVQNAGGEIL